MSIVTPTFHLLGESALLVKWPDIVSVDINGQVLRACKAIEEAMVPGVSEAQPAYSSLCVYFNPSRVRASWIRGLVERIIRNDTGEGSDTADASSPGTNSIEIPVVYGGEEGPDLESSAAELGISPSELIARHSSSVYRVYMVGFTPGFPYLGGMDQSIALPRLAKPRAKVPAGSVGIGGGQTGVYPWETPGGWRILGRTGLQMFSPHKDDPSLLHPGDSVTFVPAKPSEADPAVASNTTASRPRDSRCPQDPQVHVEALTVLHPGFFSMVVDEGRLGYRKLGVPVSGAADLRSYRLANRLVGNALGEAALEMTLFGATLLSSIDCVVAYTGARASLRVDGAEAPMDSPISLSKGSTLTIGPFETGCRGYLAILGGIDVPVVMGSRSTYVRGRFGGFQGRPLRMGDAIAVGPAPSMPAVKPDVPFTPSITADLEQPCFILHVLEGPEAEPHLVEALCAGEYTVNPESDRMGLRLSGPEVPVGKGDILSSAVIPGLIEVPADGKPLLLLCDCQTTGGYRRIAVVTEQDLSMAGQLRPGAKVRFTRAK